MLFRSLVLTPLLGGVSFFKGNTLPLAEKPECQEGTEIGLSRELSANKKQ